jgi:hypothetical protein
MPTYTVHEPSRRDDDEVAHTARVVFVRDGFHFWAFVFGPLWMLRHRLWLETVVYLLIVGALTFALAQLGIAAVAVWVVLLVSLLVGMEASSLRRWKLARRGFENVGVVVGEDIENAERRFFDGWVDRDEPPAARPVAAAPSPFAPPAGDIVGLFPQPEPRR